ncbi:MAG: glutamine--fructose-6-phosphate transaminase (isomerizing) [Verrucomicrobia bacterium]|nr:glutamine--fructose-6-phosphate transaminase (isomerizing) [Verrucomicrobiota bacterium]
MCGIVGYIGQRPAEPLLLEGLRRLEYRGYDSAGMSTLADGQLRTIKRVGKINEGLAPALAATPLPGSTGICHTRWATHGPPTDANAHPHFDQSGRLALVHNGVIENYAALKQRLAKLGHTFRSDTDSEVLAQLVGHYYDQLPAGNGDERLVNAVRSALGEVTGTYGIAVLHRDHPQLMVGARRGSPLVLGVGKGENFLASDVNAIVAHTRDVVYLNDFDVAAITRDNFQIHSLTSGAVSRQISHVEWSADAAEKGEFAHFMLKEIHEQPQAVLNALRGRINHEESTSRFGGLNMTASQLREVDRVIFCACGTAWHAALVGEYLFEELARVPAEVEYASEFRYRNPPVDKGTLVFVISQSGETADTLAALRESRRKGHKTLAIVNVVGSTIAREADGGVYMHAGPEVGVAATKSYVSQLTVLALLALYMGRIRHLSAIQGQNAIRELEAIPGKIQQLLKQNDPIRRIAEKYQHAKDFLFLGRQFNYPIALEGALKLKEISYIHAEGYPSAEMKHGPIALVSPDVPSVFICPRDAVYEKTFSNIEEIKARKGPIIAIATEGDTHIASKADDVIYVPPTADFFYPLLTVVPLQLLAYHIAVLRGCDVDKPRNLAKSVTVE